MKPFYFGEKNQITELTPKICQNNHFSTLFYAKIQIKTFLSIGILLLIERYHNVWSHFAGPQLRKRAATIAKVGVLYQWPWHRYVQCGVSRVRLACLLLSPILTLLTSLQPLLLLLSVRSFARACEPLYVVFLLPSLWSRAAKWRILCVQSTLGKKGACHLLAEGQRITES